MAGEHGESEEHGEGIARQTPASLSREQQHARDRAAFLAGGDDSEESADGPAATIADDADEGDQTDSGTEDGRDATSDEEATAEDESEDAADESTDEDEAPDADTAKRLAAVRKAEQRSRAQIATERDALASERTAFVDEWKPKVEAAQRFERLASRVRYNTVEVLTELGLSPDDFEDAAREIYAASANGAKEPKNKEAVTRRAREKELQDRLDTIQKKLEAREAADQEAASKAAVEQELAAYVGKVAKAADAAKFPLAAAALAKNAERARGALRAVAIELAQRDRAEPSPTAVLKEYETRRKAELEDLGIDPATIIKGSSASPKPTATKPAAKPAGKINGSPAKSATPSKAEILRELEAGSFD